MKNSNDHILQRIQIDNKLSQGLSIPMTIVTSPMGYGKTTAVKSFLQKRKETVLWTTMTDAGDTVNSEYFWLLITREIFNVSPELGQNFEGRGFPNDSAQIFRLLDFLKNFPVSSERTFVLVIDDYWLIENREINTLLRQLAYAKLPWLRLIIISRRVPNLPVDEMVMKELCIVVDFDDLIFTWEDAQNYFRLIDFSGDENMQKKIYEQSKGWIAALYIISRNYFNGHPIEDLKRMLKDSLFDNYSKSHQEALVKFSYFSTISPKQAAYIFDDYNMAVLLEQFYKDNAFITRDEKSNYKFHQIFLNFLRDEQTKYDFDLQSVYHRAGEWFAMNNDHVMAFRYWQMSGDYQYILGSLEITDISHINSLDRKLIFPIFNAVSKTLWYKYPIATLKYIFLLVLYNEKEHASYLLNEFDIYFQENEHSKYSRSQLLAESQIVRTSLAFNDMTQIIEHSRKAYNLFDGKISFMRKRNGVYTYGCPHFSYMYYNTPGKYRDLINEIQEGFDYHIKACNGCGAGASSLVLAEYYLETGDFEKVEAYALEAKCISMQYEQTCIITASNFVLARLYRIANKTLELNQVVEEMEFLRRNEKNPLNSDVLDNALGYIHVLMNNIEKIPDWLRNDDINYRFSSYQGTAFNRLVYQMTLIQQKDYDTFALKKNSFIMDFKQFHNQFGIAVFHVNYSVVLYHTDGLPAAASELEKALDIALKDHLVLIFAERAQELLPILEKGSFKISPEFISELIEICRSSLDFVTRKTSLSVLSDREIDIMELLKDGVNIADIAEFLYISPNTVKRHLQNIYRKLNVHNKTLAINAYLELYNNKPPA